MAEYFCNSVGILQQCAPPGQFGGFEKAQSKPPAVQNEGTSKFYKQKLFLETLDLLLHVRLICQPLGALLHPGCCFVFNAMMLKTCTD